MEDNLKKEIDKLVALSADLAGADGAVRLAKHRLNVCSEARGGCVDCEKCFGTDCGFYKLADKAEKELDKAEQAVLRQARMVAFVKAFGNAETVEL